MRLEKQKTEGKHMSLYKQLVTISMVTAISTMHPATTPHHSASVPPSTVASTSNQTSTSQQSVKKINRYPSAADFPQFFRVSSK